MQSPMLELNTVQTDIISSKHLAAASGERVLLSGPSGSGKSYFLRILADLVPWQGAISLNGKPASAIPGPEWRQRVMLVPSASHWWQPLVEDHFTHPSDAPLEALGLDRGILKKDPQYLSSGERQRLALLRALDRKPAVLLLDEPSANLDPERTGQMETLLNDWCKKTPGLLVMTSHDPAQRTRMADRLWQIRGGQVIDTGEHA
ncbi:ABC transporter ATP-binding protein [Marinobacter zhejiangensis]|uniref:ABC transporter n=1 Tax=Marinobacter zhejiangensis TaxID=488535 RepID=A0A1I4Q3J3_9GAMM|nr:ATP-binding cassette domain-containing protein [Marinobacter zhejiangensis]SFM34436.1 ABC transporter [Marinobacter zhejiangensis]